MGLRICFVLLLFFLLVGIATPSFLEYDKLETPDGEGRSLLDHSPDCPFDVENMNYTILTSQCKKEPHYIPKKCCTSFKELTCKHRKDLNSNTNSCASLMFKNIHGKYQYPVGLFAGLFSDQCKEDDRGLDCSGYY